MPPQAALGIAAAMLELRDRALRSELQPLPQHRLLLLGRIQREEARAGQRFGGAAEVANKCMVRECQNPLAREPADELGLILDDAAVAPLARLERALRREMLGARLILGERAAHRRREARYILLEHIVGRAGVQALDRALLAQGSGDED